jgi:hypothetical protein
LFISLFCGTTALRDHHAAQLVVVEQPAFANDHSHCIVNLLCLLLLIGVGMGADISTNPGYVAKEGKTFFIEELLC